MDSSYVILGFRRERDENCPLLAYYAVSGGNFLPTFRDLLSRKVGKNLRPLTAY